MEKKEKIEEKKKKRKIIDHTIGQKKVRNNHHRRKCAKLNNNFKLNILDNQPQNSTFLVSECDSLSHRHFYSTEQGVFMVKINVHHVLNILTFFFLAYICSEYASRSLHYISESLSLASFYKALAVCSSLFSCFTDFYSSFFPLSVKFKQTLCFIPTSLLPFLSHNFQHPSALVSVLLEFGGIYGVSRRRFFQGIE